MKRFFRAQFLCALCALSAGLCVALTAQNATATTLTWSNLAGSSPNVDGGGTWANGSGSTPAVPGWNDATFTATNWNNANPDSAVIGVGNGAAGTIALGSPIVLDGSLVFNAPGSGTYTITDGGTNTNTITFTNTTITSNADEKIAANLASGSSFTKNGTGQLNYTMGTGYVLASVLPNNTSITVNNGTLLMGDASTTGPRFADGTTTVSVALGGGTMRFNNTTTPGNFIPTSVALNAGQSLISQVNNAANRFQVGSGGIVRNSGAILGVTASSSSGAGGFLTGHNLPLDTALTTFTLPGYYVIVNPGNGLSTGNGRGVADVGATTSATGNIQGNTLSYYQINNSLTTPESSLTSDNSVFNFGGNANAIGGSGVNATGFTAFTADHSIRSLKVGANVANQTLDLAGHQIALEGGGLIYANFASNNQSYTIGDSVGTGALHGGFGATSGAAGTAGVNDLVVYQASTVSTLTIACTIADNTSGLNTSVTPNVVVPTGFAAQPTGFTKGGAGVLILSGSNTYTGANYIDQGTVSISSNANLGAAATGAAVNLSGGALLATANMTMDNAGANKRAFTIGEKGGVMAADATHVLTISGGITTVAGATTAPVTFGVATTGIGGVNLTGNNSYTGTTTVAAGTLFVNGTNSGGGAYAVASGGTLGGAGSIITANNAGAAVLAGGKLAPGNSPGTLSMNLGTGAMNISAAVTAVGSQSMIFDLDTPGTSDLVKLTNVQSSLNIGSGLLEFDDFVFNPTVNFGTGTYTLFDTSNNLIGTLGANLSGAIGAGFSGTLGLADGGHDVVLTVTPVPEPASVVLMVFGALALGTIARHRRS